MRYADTARATDSYKVPRISLTIALYQSERRDNETYDANILKSTIWLHAEILSRAKMFGGL